MPYCIKCGNALPEGAKYCSVCGTAVAMEDAPVAPAVSTTPVVPEAAGIKLAFWGERFVAWLMDVVIIGAIVFILRLMGLSYSLGPSWSDWIPLFNFKISGVALFLYWMFMDGVYGQSFGKIVMRIKVTRLDGSKIGMGNAALESVGKAFLLPLDCLLGWILYPRRHQRIFNYLSETTVTRVT